MAPSKTPEGGLRVKCVIVGNSGVVNWRSHRWKAEGKMDAKEGKAGKEAKGRSSSESGVKSSYSIRGTDAEAEMRLLSRFGKKLFSVPGLQFLPANPFNKGSGKHFAVEEEPVLDREGGTLRIQTQEDLAHATFLQAVMKEYIEAKPMRDSTASTDDEQVPRRARLNKLSLLVGKYEELHRLET